jgi:hypothetical protein
MYKASFIPVFYAFRTASFMKQGNKQINKPAAKKITKASTLKQIKKI